ncbi:MAG: cation:proton antiporter, partial [Microcystaceae cyanobacterium]
IGISKGDFTIFSFLILIGSLAIYTLVVLFGFDWAGREFFRRSGADEGNQFLFVLLAVFLAAFGAEWIGVEKIVGAFLAGLAVNDALGDGAVKEKVIFVGSVLFISIFFVDIGLLINLPAFVSSLSSLWLTLAIVIGLLFSKFAAALITKLVYRYNWHEMLTIWSLSIPQVAATLAAALVGNRAGLLSDEVLNSVVVMMVVTSMLSPLILSRSARELSVPAENESNIQTALFSWKTGSAAHPFTVVVPIANPQTEQYLIEMAALIARHENGRIVPLVITITHPYMDASALQEAVGRSEILVEKAVAFSQDLAVKAEPLLRIDDQVAQGISRASQEQKASLIVMGWGKRSGFRARLFGSVIDRVFESAHCPVAVSRLLDSPTQIRCILVPIENFSQRVSRKVYLTQVLADANQAEVTLLRV